MPRGIEVRVVACRGKDGDDVSDLDAEGWERASSKGQGWAVEPGRLASRGWRHMPGNTGTSKSYLHH